MIEHLPTLEDRRNCLEEIYRIMSPDARLALTAYNYSWDKRRRAPREGFHGSDLYYYRFESGEIRRLLDKYRVRKLTAILNLPASVRVQRLDRLISALPPLASLTGELLFVVAEPKHAT